MGSSTCNDTITTFTNNINDEYVTLFCFIFKMASRFGEGVFEHVTQHLKNHRYFVLFLKWHLDLGEGGSLNT